MKKVFGRADDIACCIVYMLRHCGCGGGKNHSDGADTEQGDTGHIHSYGEWNIIEPTTHATTGTRCKYCSCGEHFDEAIPKTKEHEFGNWQTTHEGVHEP